MRELLSYVVISFSSPQVSPTSSSVISIASHTGDGRDATSRPNGDDDDGGGANEGEAAMAAWAAVQAAACQGLESPA
jgi:hypothetical protein